MQTNVVKFGENHFVIGKCSGYTCGRGCTSEICDKSRRSELTGKRSWDRMKLFCQLWFSVRSCTIGDNYGAGIEMVAWEGILFLLFRVREMNLVIHEMTIFRLKK